MQDRDTNNKQTKIIDNQYDAVSNWNTKWAVWKTPRNKMTNSCVRRKIKLKQ